MKKHILVIDDDPELLDNVLELLYAEGYDAVGAGHGRAGVAAALQRVPDLVVCDIGMPVMDGYEVLHALRDHPETSLVPFIFLTALAERSDVRKGMTMGADDYVTKPFERQDLLQAIRTRLERANALTSARVPAPGASSTKAAAGPIVVSKPLKDVYAKAMRYAWTDLSALILGETGVGKDVLAYAIHKESRRSKRSFMPLNCTSLSETLVESELFGHEKGAFTGAGDRKAGLLESADGGTVFLDEIGDLPLATQAKLLRVLEDKKVLPVGGRAYREVDVRFVFATHKDLVKEVEKGRFREDLYYRISVATLLVPPLRDRIADIGALAEHFALAASRRWEYRVPVQVSPSAIRLLERWPWPGNVRELRNVIELCVVEVGDGGVIHAADLPERFDGSGPPAAPPPSGPGRVTTLAEEKEMLEREAIIEALEKFGGNQTRAAKALGMSRRTLINRLDKYGLKRPRKPVDAHDDDSEE